MAAPDARGRPQVTTPTPRVIVPGMRRKGEVFPVKSIISHQMETGLARRRTRRGDPAQDHQQVCLPLRRRCGVQCRSSRGDVGQSLHRIFARGDGKRPARIHLGRGRRRRLSVSHELVVEYDDGERAALACDSDSWGLCLGVGLFLPRACRSCGEPPEPWNRPRRQLASICASCHASTAATRGIPDRGPGREADLEAMHRYRD